MLNYNFLLNFCATRKGTVLIKTIVDLNHVCTYLDQILNNTNFLMLL